MRGSSAWALGLALAISVGAPRSAAGQDEPVPAEPPDDTSAPSTPTSAEALYQAGFEALKGKDLEVAEVAFARGLKVVPPGEGRFRMLLGMALTLEFSGEPAPAWWHYRAFIVASTQHPDGDKEEWRARRERVEADVRKLETTLQTSHARVRVVSRPAEATLVVDDTPLPIEIVTPAVVFVEAGTRRITVRFGSGEDRTELETSAGGRYLVEAEAQEVEPPPGPDVERPPSPTPPTPSSVPEPAAPTNDVSLSVVGYSLLGLGGVALATGAVFTGLSYATRDDLDELSAPTVTAEVDAFLSRDAALRDRLGFQQGIAAGLYIGAAALVAGGVAILILDDDDAVETTLRVHPTGLGLSRRF